MTTKKTIITLTTDFGMDDAYVGIMKGVISSIAPEAQLIDLSHSIEPQNIRQGAFVLWSAVEAFPPGTIHLAVVDPEVGSQRKAIAIQAGGHKFVGPDNGLLMPAAQRFSRLRVRELNRTEWMREEVSASFHGRDIFAPVAAHLAKGVAFEEIGSELAKPRPMELFDTTTTQKWTEGRVLASDHFGNLITNIPQSALRFIEDLSRCRIIAGTHYLQGLKRSFFEVEKGEPLAYINSFGLLEIAVRNGSAREQLHLSTETPVRVVFNPVTDI